MTQATYPTTNADEEARFARVGTSRPQHVFAAPGNTNYWSYIGGYDVAEAGTAIKTLRMRGYRTYHYSMDGVASRQGVLSALQYIRDHLREERPLNVAA